MIGLRCCRDVCLFVCLFAFVAAGCQHLGMEHTCGSCFSIPFSQNLPVNCCVHISTVVSTFHRSAYFFLRAGKVPPADFPQGMVCKVVVEKKRPGGHFSGGALDLWSPLDAVARCQRCSKPSHTAAWGAADSFVMAWFLYRLVNAVRQTGHS